MKKSLLVMVFLVFWWPLAGQQPQDAYDLLSPEAKEKLIEMFMENYSFTKSKEYKNYPETLNNYFTEPIYQRLQGNFMRGYSFDEGFSFQGDTLSISTLKSVTEGKAYLKKFVDVLNEVFLGNGIKFAEGGTRYEIGICIVSVTPKLTEISFPGLFLEVLLSDTKSGKSYFYRFGQGSKAGIEKAMIDSACMVLATLFTLSSDRKPE